MATLSQEAQQAAVELDYGSELGGRLAQNPTRCSSVSTSR